ncbi:hypothetical protein [Georgenia sp. MJ170]|uniref:hypothetical protein n=1 Tax=Georgenia sunbinii TaxID=3117728 RepID=UPI002F262C12
MIRQLRRMVPAAVLTVALAVGAGGCTATDATAEAPATSAGARPLTTDESQRLAAMRFQNFDAGARAIETEVTDSGTRYTVTGWVDFTAELGYGRIEGAASGASLLAWTHAGISTYDGVPADGSVPLPPPGTADGAQGWTSSTLEPDASRLHALLAVVLHVGSERPDNPLLLQQTDARWLRTDTLDGLTLDVMSAPTADVVYVPETSTAAGDGSDSPLRYWLDESGTLHRMEVRLGGAGEWTTVDLADADGVSFAAAFTDEAGTEEAGTDEAAPAGAP